MKGKLLFRVVDHNGGLVFATEDRARFVARIHEAISTAKTWADFRRKVPRPAYSTVIRLLDERGEPRPRNTNAFSGEMVPGWADGDFPPWLQAEMPKLIPRHLLEHFGRQQPTSLNGSFWWLPPESADPLCAELSALGWQTEHSPDLRFW